MNSDPARKNWGGKPNQLPEPECCRAEGQAQAPVRDAQSRTTAWKRTQGSSQAASGSRTPLKQSSLETSQHAGGDGVASPEPNTEETATGEVSGDLPGSQSVAREQRAVRKLGSPAAPRRTNCGGQSGQEVQRQEDLPKGIEQGIGPVHSSPGPGTRCPSPDQGAGTTTQPAKETSAVSTTESGWRTFLQASQRVVVKSPVRENRPPGSARGTRGNPRPYSTPDGLACHRAPDAPRQVLMGGRRPGVVNGGKSCQRAIPSDGSHWSLTPGVCLVC